MKICHLFIYIYFHHQRFYFKLHAHDSLTDGRNVLLLSSSSSPSRSMIRKDEQRIEEHRDVTTAERAVPSASDSLDTVHSRLATSRKRRRKKEKGGLRAGQMHSPPRQYSRHCTLLAILRNHRNPMREKLRAVRVTRITSTFSRILCPSLYTDRFSSLDTAHLVQSRQCDCIPIISYEFFHGRRSRAYLIDTRAIVIELCKLT